jgi:hypothetical protein
LSGKEFAAELGVNAATLAHWKYRLAAEARNAVKQSTESQEAVRFVEVESAALEVEAAGKATPQALELVLASGATVRIPADFDAATLRRLLDVMAKR